MHLTIKTIIRLADWHLRLCSSASFMLLSAVIFLWPVNASGEETVGSSTSLVEPVYSCESSGYQKPYVSFNGSQVLYTDGAQVTGRDPKTGLVRWQGGNLKHVRRVLDFAKTVLLVGEHLQMVEKEWGKQAWDFPLNCFPNECNADVLAITGTQALVGGFGTVFNMVNLINLETGKEVWPSWLTACKYRTAAIISDSVILACKSPGPLLQRIDISSRRTLFTAPRPDPGFTPSQLWASSRYLFVDGTLALR